MNILFQLNRWKGPKDCSRPILQRNCKKRKESSKNQELQEVCESVLPEFLCYICYSLLGNGNPPILWCLMIIIFYRSIFNMLIFHLWLHFFMNYIYLLISSYFSDSSFPFCCKIVCQTHYVYNLKESTICLIGQQPAK